MGWPASLGLRVAAVNAAPARSLAKWRASVMLCAMKLSILWFRQDLRLADHSALQAALARGGAVLPLYIDAAEEESAWASGGAGRWWLGQSLQALAAELATRGSQLLVRRGPRYACCRRWSPRAVPTPFSGPVVRAEARGGRPDTPAHLRESGLLAECRGGRLLAEPEQLRTQSGGPFQIFTPYWRAFLREIEPPLPLSAPRALPVPAHWPASDPAVLPSWSLTGTG